MRNIDTRLRNLEGVTACKPISIIWWGEQTEAELKAEVAFQVLVVSWKR